MAKTPQISNAETYKRLGTTPLGVTGMPPSSTDADTLPSDLAPDVIKVGGHSFTVSQSGRITGWDRVGTGHD